MKRIIIAIFCAALTLSMFAGYAAALKGEDMGSFVLVDQRKNPVDSGESMNAEQAALIVEDMLINSYEGDIDQEDTMYVLLKGMKKVNGSTGYWFCVGQGNTNEFAAYFQAIVTYDGDVYYKGNGSGKFTYYGCYTPFEAGSSANVVFVDQRKNPGDSGDYISAEEAAGIVNDALITNYEGHIDTELNWYTVLKGYKAVNGDEGYLFYVGQGSQEEFAEYFRVVITYNGTIYLREKGGTSYVEFGTFPVG